MHSTWKRVVLESYPKVDVSPEREIVGLNALVNSRASAYRDTFARSYRPKRERGIQPRRSEPRDLTRKG